MLHIRTCIKKPKASAQRKKGLSCHLQIPKSNLCIRTVSSGPSLLVDLFYSIQCLCKRTLKVPLSCVFAQADLSPLLFTYGWKTPYLHQASCKCKVSVVVYPTCPCHSIFKVKTRTNLRMRTVSLWSMLLEIQTYNIPDFCPYIGNCCFPVNWKLSHILWNFTFGLMRSANSQNSQN